MSPFNNRRPSKELTVRDVKIGNNNPIIIQSMCTTNTYDIEKTLFQIRELAVAGCQVVRVAVPEANSANALADIVKESPIPVIADIHFDWRLAIKALESGIDGLRLNPGNIGNKSRVQEVISAAQERQVPIRIGVNAGSLEREFAQKYPDNIPQAMVESALSHIRILEDLNYNNIKVSLKASDAPTMIQAYRLMANKCEYPLHLGVTEAGTPNMGIMKSAIGIGTLLSEGIGDTMRVSLTADPVQEVEAAKNILKTLGFRKEGLNLISCPSCGRIATDKLYYWAGLVEKELADLEYPLTIAVMGCAVNGPGESAHADLGISFGGVDADGITQGIMVKNGEIYKKLPEEQLVPALIKEARTMAASLNATNN